MHLLGSSVIVVAICSASVFYAQNIGTLENTRRRQIKSENGLILSWQGNSSEPNDKQVEVFDEEGHPVVSLNILRSVPEAGRVGIYDVSARSGQMIAVAAVFAKAGNRHLRPVPTLLLFDFNGRLSSAFALEPSRQIHRLAVDEKSNVWTITDHSDNRDPSTVPMVVEYTSAGVVSKELLMRDKFPLHARATLEDALIGRAFMGYDSGGLWFWLPGSTEVVAISPNDGKTTIVKTRLPQVKGRTGVVPLRFARDSSGRIAAQFREDRPQRESKVANYLFSASTGWSRLESSSCGGGMLLGTSDKGLLYLQYEKHSDRATVCVSPAK
jgi:hypothetical protein